MGIFKLHNNKKNIPQASNLLSCIILGGTFPLCALVLECFFSLIEVRGFSKETIGGFHYFLFVLFISAIVILALYTLMLKIIFLLISVLKLSFTRTNKEEDI